MAVIDNAGIQTTMFLTVVERLNMIDPVHKISKKLSDGGFPKPATGY